MELLAGKVCWHFQGSGELFRLHEILQDGCMNRITYFTVTVVPDSSVLAKSGR
eukprot:m.213394 g.213394  ORF g.213394 m.213394 type:complete len:53 (+) comp39785_c0_seq4:638-796(+)